VLLRVGTDRAGNRRVVAGRIIEPRRKSGRCETCQRAHWNAGRTPPATRAAQVPRVCNNASIVSRRFVHRQ
jgi:hypothetical protein